MSVTETANRQRLLLVAEGQSESDLYWNTNSRYRFLKGARLFVNGWNSHGPAHHCAVDLRHYQLKIKKPGTL
ncbi:hypothetical protein EXU57_01765 [Segetibacter sp. 3557_3]|uniref:hypothetical protein n=1 Tax=Segetibacter sp. 3557_3 TaxID=2547429 RepID=UPI0010589A85|nr:hypothetical protein [Segetibacter sp. 3557_3]TDH28822.1 hypothetical protein EXU57_01765 [Segetibacter sp. 3557_3]